MAILRKQAACKLRRGKVHPKKAVCWQWETIKASGSEELNYIIELITGGHRPGRAIPDERTKDTNSR
ncbi:MULTISPECIES: hypothetical protein [Paenibacillus]|uniref:Uncharacterized protein n=1 Tax=Paenibacillus odorifer TaxID=189426 RepID=A0ABX3HYJ4_9BACL|nr:hypothetical protein [Paenibacillus odorifer]OMD55251.1 hypothetical protein BSK51_04150 [Paenibacillus odorifer]